jgi:hypothetical protein
MGANLAAIPAIFVLKSVAPMGRSYGVLHYRYGGKTKGKRAKGKSTKSKGL